MAKPSAPSARLSWRLAVSMPSRSASKTADRRALKPPPGSVEPAAPISSASAPPDIAHPSAGSGRTEPSPSEPSGVPQAGAGWSAPRQADFPRRAAPLPADSGLPGHPSEHHPGRTPMVITQDEHTEHHPGRTPMQADTDGHHPGRTPMVIMWPTSDPVRMTKVRPSSGAMAIVGKLPVTYCRCFRPARRTLGRPSLRKPASRFRRLRIRP
jgi:hypothetical protein